MRIPIYLTTALLGTAGIGEACLAFPQSPTTRAAEAEVQAPSETDWREAERGFLENHLQLTSPDRFVKAGESYFSPDDSKVIFQAVEVPPAGQAPDEFYAMFVADVLRDGHGRITGLGDIRRISPAGSANTCGWFHPNDPELVIFASTIGRPSDSTPPGYQRASGRYRWMFPPEMNIVSVRLDEADGTAAPLHMLVSRDQAYVAEGSLSNDGRYLLYCSLESNEGDLFVLDRKTGRTTRLVQARGYDGGPFFSPDGRRICYRSDRRGDHLLQLFVSELAVDDEGSPVGIAREYQLTDDENVNWCPFWHPDGRFLLYATSAVGHHNYEVFMIDADPGDLPGSTGTTRYGTRPSRITHAAGADVLPAFSHDGKTMIWTSKRGADQTSQLWVADFVFDPEARPQSSTDEQSPPQKQ